MKVNCVLRLHLLQQIYEHIDHTLRSVIYYRLKSVNNNAAENYELEFYTDTIVVRRDAEPDAVHYVISNPFKDRIGISFTSPMDQVVSLKLFDTSGKLVREQTETPNNIATEINGLDLAPGIYILSIQIGQGEPKSYK